MHAEDQCNMAKISAIWTSKVKPIAPLQPPVACPAITKSYCFTTRSYISGQQLCGPTWNRPPLCTGRSSLVQEMSGWGKPDAAHSSLTESPTSELKSCGVLRKYGLAATPKQPFVSDTNNSLIQTKHTVLHIKRNHRKG